MRFIWKLPLVLACMTVLIEGEMLERSPKDRFLSQIRGLTAVRQTFRAPG